MSETALQLRHDPQLAVMRPSEALGVEEIMAQVSLIQSVMHKVMQEGQHFGSIPGCGDKKTLLQPGAQKLTMTFRLAPEYAIQETDLPRGHKEYRVICTLKSIQSGTFVGQGVGCCSSMESKYRWRQGARKCPKCGKETIIKGKAEYGGGWLCYGKKGGCNAKWGDGAAEIEGQNIDKVENENPADTFNTVLKIAKKRAFVDATITATAASDIFTQDIGDEESDGEPRKPQQAAAVESESGFDDAAPRPAKPAQQQMPHLKPTTTPLAPAPVSPFAFKNDKERRAWFDLHLEKCKLALVSKLEAGGVPETLEFLVKAGHILPTETAADANCLTLFKDVPIAPDERETDGDWKARVNEAIAKAAKQIERDFGAFVRGDTLEGAEVPEPEPQAEVVPALPDDAKEMSGFIKLVNKKPTSKGGTKYGILIVQDLQDKEGGEWVNSFDQKDGELAESLKGQEVALAYTESQWGKDLCKHAIREVR